MGFKSISEYGANPTFQTLVGDGKTDSSVFAFKLSSSGAELSVGGTDSSLYSGDFTYAKVEKEVSRYGLTCLIFTNNFSGLLASCPRRYQRWWQ